MLAPSRTNNMFSLGTGQPRSTKVAAEGQDSHLLQQDVPRSDGSKTTSATGTLPELTGLRGLAALQVVIYHVRASDILGRFETIDQE